MITLYLNAKSPKPYYEQIYEYIKMEIRSGRLACHTKLPSSRMFARHLEVSRSTVDNAYAQLQAEGYVVSIPKKGYYVCQIDELINIAPVAYPASNKTKEPKPTYRWDFSPTGTDGLNFPELYWRKLSRECINYDNGQMFQSGDPQGDAELRQSLRDYLRQNRGVNCSVENIIIGAGSQYLLMLLSRLLGKKSVIAMENPAYMQTYQTLKSLEHQVLPIGVDEYGMDVEELCRSQANVAYVTPAHQYPLGIVMPVSRRMKLLNWANYEPDRYLIEDDYDSEFRYQGKPIPALQSMDRGKKVIYMGSFSKVISPAVRMSYMVLPDILMERYRHIFASFPSTVSRLDQAIMTRFIREGYYERHLNRLRTRYKQRHDVMIQCLKEAGDKVQLSGTNAGSYLILEWMGQMQEKELAQAAAQAGIKVYPLEAYFITPLLRMYPTFLMGFAQLSEEEIRAGLQTLLQIWK